MPNAVGIIIPSVIISILYDIGPFFIARSENTSIPVVVSAIIIERMSEYAEILPRGMNAQKITEPIQQIIL